MKFLGKLLSRVVIVSMGIAIQLAWLIFIAYYFSAYYLPIAFVLSAISLVAALLIVKKPAQPAVKLAWVVLVLTFPIFGGIIYFISGGKGPKKKLRQALARSREDMAHCVAYSEPTLEKLAQREPDKHIGTQCRYLAESGFPIYENTAAEYFDNGRDTWLRMLDDLRHAEKYIFLEYFIIRHGKMWDAVLDILKEKAKRGLDVRIIYDDVGSISYLPRKYAKKIEALGIKCIAFNRYRPVYSVIMNNRDHRKILVIDGNTAYTGGINFADEYIGEETRFGVWKDNGLRLEGDGVRSMTLMFLQMWNALRPTDSPEAVRSFMPDEEFCKTVSADGFVQPYGDSPVEKEPLAENVYLSIIHSATDYLYIASPYVVIDDALEDALCLAAKRGVDVRIVVPEIPDKKIVYHLTKSHFPKLIENGVKMYKYTPGFVHSKVFVADDKIAVVGSINIDYRSLMLHFENACLFVDHNVVADAKRDFDSTFGECELVKPIEPRFDMLYDLYIAILKLFAPLL
ncbi:MAG: cardiolipin synthase [Clostridia bacterium]|nr:cardiolipin synthase [Clostridia bacterium]